MDSNNNSKASAFDALYSNNQIQMLKIILSYMDKQTQKSMAIYIKFLELIYTINYFKKNPYPAFNCCENETTFDMSKMCTELLPYCTEQQKNQIKQMQNIFQTMEMYKEMSKTMDIMKEFMPDMANMFQDNDNKKSASTGENNGSFDMMDMLMNMLSPEQKEMFNMFNS